MKVLEKEKLLSKYPDDWYKTLDRHNRQIDVDIEFYTRNDEIRVLITVSDHGIVVNTRDTKVYSVALTFLNRLLKKKVDDDSRDM